MPGPVPVFPPSKDADLLSWSSNFDSLITASAVTYGLDAGQATAYTALHDSFVSAYNISQNPNTNSKANVNAKNVAKDNLLNGSGGAWDLVDIVQAFPGTTDVMRGQLGLRIPDSDPTPVPAPSTAPDLSIISTFGRTIKVRLRDQENPDSRGKPDGVQGATVIYHVGESAPSDPAQWTFAMNVSKTTFDVEVPSSIEAGSKVFLTAFWFNARKESSPAASPEHTIIGDGLAAAA